VSFWPVYSAWLLATARTGLLTVTQQSLTSTVIRASVILLQSTPKKIYNRNIVLQSWSDTGHSRAVKSSRQAVPGPDSHFG
jgi:hypothetical protein